MKRMKRFTALIAVLALALALCAGCADKGSQHVVYVYNWGEYMDESLNDEFTAKTGIKVVYDYFDTNESMYALLKGGTAKYDVVIPSDYMIGKMINEDMLEKIDFSKIPNYANIDSRFKDLPFDPDNEYSVPYLWGILGIIYNKTMVDGEIDSWDVLWDEKYSGNILMIGNPRDAVAIALKKLGYSLNSVNEAEVLGAGNELQKQKSLIQGYFMDQNYNKMEGNSAAICAYYSGDALVMMQNNTDLAFAVPSTGSNYYVDSLCIPKGSENYDEACEYINFMLEAESGKRNSEFVCGSTPNAEAYKLLDLTDEEKTLLYPSDAVLGKSEMYITLPDNINEMYNKIWTELGQ